MKRQKDRATWRKAFMEKEATKKEGKGERESG